MYLIICILLIFAEAATAQDIPKDKIMHYDAAALAIDTVSNCLYSADIDNDTLAIAFRLAMSFFPELCNQKINLKYANIKTSMAAQPRVLSVFLNRKNRTYNVIINKNQQKEQARLLHAAPFNAVVGVMGHELAHILDYVSKSGWQLTWTGIRYAGKNYRRQLERQTDLMTIERGLGWQLYHFSYFLLHQADIDEEYRRYKLDLYMKPEEILEIMLP